MPAALASSQRLARRDGAVLSKRTRTEESATRLRARDLARRTLGAEAETRRRLAESLHDGPVQGLIGLDMVLGAADKAVESAQTGRARELLAEARTLTERSVQQLRDEIVALGPPPSEELSFEEAVRNCLPTWKRRFGIDVVLEAEPLTLSSEMAGELFRLAQEAVTNAGRHAEASAIAIDLRRSGGDVVLRVRDDGRGFGEVDPLGSAQPGHFGIAAMRERAALLYGELEIDSSGRGTDVTVRAPLPGGYAPA
jgi:signal transduction histidine kinase